MSVKVTAYKDCLFYSTRNKRVNIEPYYSEIDTRALVYRIIFIRNINKEFIDSFIKVNKDTVNPVHTEWIVTNRSKTKGVRYYIVIISSIALDMLDHGNQYYLKQFKTINYGRN